MSDSVSASTGAKMSVTARFDKGGRLTVNWLLSDRVLLSSFGYSTTVLPMSVITCARSRPAKPVLPLWTGKVKRISRVCDWPTASGSSIRLSADSDHSVPLSATSVMRSVRAPAASAPLLVTV